MFWHSHYGVVWCCYQMKFSFSLKISLPFDVQVFSRDISLVCGLKSSYSCFSSHWCFLVIFVLLMFVLSVLFLVALSSFPLCFLIHHYIDSSTLSSMLTRPGSLLDTFSLSTSSKACTALCIDMNFLFSDPFVGLLKEWSQVPYEGTAQTFIPVMRFLPCILLSRCFLVLLRYSFFLSFLSSSYIVRFQYSQVFVSFFFSELSAFSWFGNSVASIICYFRFSFLAGHIFMLNSIIISWLYITACSMVS